MKGMVVFRGKKSFVLTKADLEWLTESVRQRVAEICAAGHLSPPERKREEFYWYQEYMRLLLVSKEERGYFTIGKAKQ